VLKKLPDSGICLYDENLKFLKRLEPEQVSLFYVTKDEKIIAETTEGDIYIIFNKLSDKFILLNNFICFFGI
jgi:hypothetical protein